MATDRTDKSVANDYWLEQQRQAVRIMAWYDPISDEVREIKVGEDWSLLNGVDGSWRSSFNTIFGDKVTATKQDNILLKFDYGILSSLMSTTTANGGAVSESNGRAKINSSTATNGQARLESKDRVRYAPWHDIYCYFTAVWENGWVAWATQFFGIYDDNDWYRIGYDWTDFKVQRIADWSVDVELTQANFNHDTLDGNGASGFTLDQTKMNIFRINFGYLWIAPAYFEVFGGHDKGWIHFADIDTVNTQAELAVRDPDLPFRMDITKTSWATDLVCYSWSVWAWYYNWDRAFVWTIPNSHDNGTWLALTWTWIENVTVYHIKETFNWRANHVNAKLQRLEANNTATSDIIKCSIIANPTTVGWTAVASLSYTDAWTESIVEVSDWGWVVVWGTVIYTTYMVWWGGWSWAFSWSSNVDADALWLVGRPWDYFAVSYQRVSWSWAYTALTALNWVELF